eukprot:7697857-Prorocentrum_lima.AAC.1
MTSSLVGSEMCIRDRGIRGRKGTCSQLASQHHDSESAGSSNIVCDSISTVSYTHLTLPTICSV